MVTPEQARREFNTAFKLRHEPGFAGSRVVAKKPSASNFEALARVLANTPRPTPKGGGSLSGARGRADSGSTALGVGNFYEQDIPGKAGVLDVFMKGLQGREDFANRVTQGVREPVQSWAAGGVGKALDYLSRPAYAAFSGLEEAVPDTYSCCSRRSKPVS
jgi:hypothetical protein